MLNIPEEAWTRARAAIQNNTDIPEDATRNELLAYNHLLRAHGRMMAEQQDSLNERKRRADASSLNRYLIASGGSRTASARGSAAEPIPRAARILPEGAAQAVARNLGRDMDAEADLIPRTPDAARVALATYLNLNQPLIIKQQSWQQIYSRRKLLHLVEGAHVATRITTHAATSHIELLIDAARSAKIGETSSTTIATNLSERHASVEPSDVPQYRSDLNSRPI